MMELTIVCISAPLLIFLANLLVDSIRLEKNKIDKRDFNILTIAKGSSCVLAGIAAWLFVYTIAIIL